MNDKVSLFKLSGLPDPFGIVLLIFSFILLLSPYFSGADFGIFKVPLFTPLTKKWLKLIGPIIFFLCVFSFLPIVTPGRDEKPTQSDIWSKIIRVKAPECKSRTDPYDDRIGGANSWADSIGDTLKGTSPEGVVAKNYILCIYNLPEPMQKFVLDFGGATINFSKTGGSGGGLGLLIYEGEPKYVTNENRWKDYGSPYGPNKWWGMTKGGPLSLSVPPESYSIDFGHEVKRITVGVVMVDAWSDTKVDIQVNGFRIRAEK